MRRTSVFNCMNWILALAVTSWISTAGAAEDFSTLEKIEVQPTQIEFHSPREKAIVLVTGYYPDGRVVDLTRQATIAPVEAGVVESSKGAVWPVGNGQATLDIQVGKHHAQATVTSDKFDLPAPGAEKN